MHCTLYIPHLIPPREAAAAWQALDTPALKTLLARVRYTRSMPKDNTSLLCELFGITSASESPIAPLLARTDGLVADNGYWLCATPVHLEARRNALVLTDPATLALSTAESNAVAATLAEHLRDEHLVLHVPQPRASHPSSHWYLRCDASPAITTTGLDSVIGHDVQPFMPQGAEALRWHRLLTEIQMLLHAHPVNDVREAAGRLPVNSVWLWGGGLLPGPSQAPFTTVWSDQAVMRALAQHAGCRIEPAARRLPDEVSPSEHHFFGLYELETALRQNDMQAWSAAVTTMDREWFQPLQATLASWSRRITHATLVCNNQEAVHRFEMGRWDHFKILNKNKYLQ